MTVTIYKMNECYRPTKILVRRYWLILVINPGMKQRENMGFLAK